MTIITPVFGADGQSYDGRRNEDEIHDYEDGLKFAHDLRHDGCQHAMAADASEENRIEVSVGGCPVAIASYDDNGEEHQREAV